MYSCLTTSSTSTFGDLAATIAAMLLDPEARSATLEADPTHGKLREPLLKVMHFLRAMEYTPYRGRELSLFAMDTQIGMGPFKSPSVFNFYTPDYQPVYNYYRADRRRAGTRAEAWDCSVCRELVERHVVVN
jgi:uncharacterized protein (DUF1800 family)